MGKALSFTCCALLLAACAATPEKDSASATAALRPASGSKVQGNVKFTQVGERVRVQGEVTGMAPGPKGFHIHEKGDCSDPKALSAGGHFNPGKHKHGGPGIAERHAGDLGNITADQNGRASFNMMVDGISVRRDGPDGIIGRGLVVHAGPDDLKTDPTGNSGDRHACGVIS